ncbi:MAG: hypothetical protein WAV46_02070 [Candidatus Moraniibacteriota bacterium]
MAASIFLSGCGGGDGGNEGSGGVAPPPAPTTVEVVCPNGKPSTGATTAEAKAACLVPVVLSVVPADGTKKVALPFAGIVVVTDSLLDMGSFTVTISVGSSVTASGPVTKTDDKGFKYLPSVVLQYGQAYSYLIKGADTFGKPIEASGSFTTATQSFDKAVVSGAVSITMMDLTTSATQTPTITDSGCLGVAYNGQTGMIRIYCSASPTTKYFWDVDPITAAATPVTAPFAGFDGVAKALLSIGANGRQYYVVGFPLSGKSSSRVVAVDNGGTKLAEIPLSTHATSSDYILWMQLDEASGKLWIASRGGVLDRIDLGTLKTDLSIATATTLNMMKIMGGNVIVAVDRTTSGADALVFNKLTGAKVKEIALPATGTTGVRLSYGMVLTTSDIVIASPGGYYRLDPETFAVRGFVPVAVFFGGTSDDMISVSGHVYGNHADDIFSLPLDLSVATKIATVAGSRGVTRVTNVTP